MMYDLPRFHPWTVTTVDDVLDKNSIKKNKNLGPVRRRENITRPSLKFNFIFWIIFLWNCLRQKNPSALCLKLESIYMAKNLSSKMHIKIKLYTRALQEGGSMLNYLLVFEGVVLDLHSMKIDYDGEDFGLIVLYPLSSFFFWQTLEIH